MLNSVTLQGNLTKELLIHEGQGFRKAAFTVAVNNYKKKDGTQDTTFAYCEVFNDRVKVAELLKKGQQIIVQGRLVTSKYTNNEGKEVNKTHIAVNEIHFTPRIKEAEPKANNEQQAKPELEEIQNTEPVPW